MGLTVTDSQRIEMFCAYASIILHDDKVDITDENIRKLISAAGGNVPTFWPKLFAGLVEKKGIMELIASATKPGTGGGGGGGGGAAGGAGGAAEAEPEEEEEEEEAADMGFSLFEAGGEGGDEEGGDY